MSTYLNVLYNITNGTNHCQQHGKEPKFLSFDTIIHQRIHQYFNGVKTACQNKITYFHKSLL